MPQPGAADPERNRAAADAAGAARDGPHGRLSPRSEALGLLRGARRIFIAYSHSDLRAAHRFRKRLVRLRRDRDPDTVFLDQDSLRPGSDVSPADIDRRLQEADLFVVLCGADTADSDHVAHEIRAAMDRRDAGGLTVLPVILVRRARLPAALDFRVQAVFLSTLFPGILLARVLVGLLIVLLAVSGAMGLRLRHQRELEAHEARTRRLVADARAVLEPAPQRAVLLAVEALHESGSDGRLLPSVRQLLRDVLDESPGYGLGYHDGAVLALSAAMGGRRVASAAADGTIRLWDVRPGEPSPAVVLRGHAGAVTSLAFDRDGASLVSGGRDGTTRLWRLGGSVAPAATILELPEPTTSGVAGVAVSPDGRAGASIDERGGWLWRLDDGRLTRPAIALPHATSPRAVAISPDGSWLVTSDCVARLWRLDAADVVARMRALGTASTCVRALAFSSDGTWLATGSQDNQLRLWNLRRPDPAARPVLVPGLEAGLHSMRGIDLVAFSPDDTIVVTGYGDGTVQLWDWRDKKRKPAPGPVLGEHGARIAGVSMAPDSSWLATRNEDGAVRFWNVDDDAVEHTSRPLTGHVGVTAATLGPPGWAVTGGGDGGVRLEPLPAIKRSEIYARSGNPTDVSADSRWIATADENGDVLLWDLSQDAPRETATVLRGSGEDVGGIVISPDARWLASTGYRGSVSLWDLRAADIVASKRSLGRGRGSSGRVLFSGDGRWLVVRDDRGYVSLRDLTAPDAPPRELNRGASGLASIVPSPDGRWLAIGDGRGSVFVWDLRSSGGDPAATLGDEHDGAGPRIITRDGWLVARAGGCRLRLWKLTAAEVAGSTIELRACGGELSALDASDDGRWLVTGGDDGAVRLWDLSAADPASSARALDSDGARVTRVVVVAGSRLVVTADARGTIRSFDLASGRVEHAAVVLDDGAAVTALAIPDDRRWLVSADDAGVVRLWDLTAEDIAASMTTLPGHRGQAVWVRTSPDGRWLVSLGIDSSVNLSNLTTEWLERRARLAVGRNLTAEEWATYFPGEVYRKTFVDLEGAAAAKP